MLTLTEQGEVHNWSEKNFQVSLTKFHIISDIQKRQKLAMSRSMQSIYLGWILLCFYFGFIFSHKIVSRVSCVHVARSSLWSETKLQGVDVSPRSRNWNTVAEQSIRIRFRNFMCQAVVSRRTKFEYVMKTPKRTWDMSRLYRAWDHTRLESDFDPNQDHENFTDRFFSSKLDGLVLFCCKSEF